MPIKLDLRYTFLATSAITKLVGDSSRSHNQLTFFYAVLNIIEQLRTYKRHKISWLLIKKKFVDGSDLVGLYIKYVVVSYRETMRNTLVRSRPALLIACTQYNQTSLRNQCRILFDFRFFNFLPMLYFFFVCG